MRTVSTGTPSFSVYTTWSPSSIPRTRKRHWAWKKLASRARSSPSGDRCSKSTLCSATGRSSSSQDSSTSAKIRSGMPIASRIMKTRPAFVRIHSMYVSLVKPSPQSGNSKRRGIFSGRRRLTMYFASRVDLIRSSGHHSEVCSY